MIWTGFGTQAEVNSRSILRRVRALENPAKKIYLTFDDGPDREGTAAVLDCLARHQARATFFVVAQKAAAQEELVQKILRSGHRIGNHSLDHSYRLFFANSETLKNWIRSSEQVLRENGVTEIAGFRPPAGVCTPPLFKALRDLNEPLVLWSHRFFDTTLSWTEPRMREVLPQLRDGDIILLHDRQKPGRLKEFISTLELFITEAKRLGFQLEYLSRDLCLQQMQRQRFA